MQCYVDQTHLPRYTRISTNVSTHLCRLLYCEIILKRQLTFRPICDTALSANFEGQPGAALLDNIKKAGSGYM
jgi:hypothetical protein